jgi:hypothetical protein
MTTGTGRRLTPGELAIVSTLLAMTHAGAARLRQQIPGLRVVGGCGCGCPTIDFRDAPDGLELIADAEVAGTGGDAILLFGHDGVLDRLEYMWVGGPAPASWPAPDALRATRSG